MPMLEIPLFGLGLQGKSPNVSANKLVNAYYEFHQQDKDRTSVSVHGTPGLTQFVNQGTNPWRGLHVFGDYIYGVNYNTFYSINNAGVVTSIGTISTSSNGRVDMCDDGISIVIVDGIDIHTYNTSTSTFAVGTDAQRPTSPNTCCFQAGRILTDEDGTGQFKGSDLYDPTAWAALDYATAESNPDNLIRVINYRGTITLFGAQTIEFWQNVGGSGFPYSRILGADVEFGLAARWSVAKFAGTYAFLAKNREGQVMVMALNGYGNPQRLSNFELEHLINNYATVSDATAFGYMLGGHPMYQINFPTANKSWLYDGSTQYWSEVRYGASNRHRAEMAVDFLDQLIVSDHSNGKLYYMQDGVYQDDGDEIHTILRGRHIFKDKKKVSFRRLELGHEGGVGGFKQVQPELVVNGGFDTDSDWGKGSGWTISGGTANASAALGVLYQTGILTVGTTYDITFTVSGYTGGNVYVQCGTTDGTSRTANGTYTETLLCAGDTNLYFSQDSALTCSIDNVSVKVSTVDDNDVDPMAGLRVSKDGGHTWSNQTFSPLGNRGEYDNRCIFRQLGSGRDIVPEITITDNVKRVLTDATLVVQEGYH